MIDRNRDPRTIALWDMVCGKNPDLAKVQELITQGARADSEDLETGTCLLMRAVRTKNQALIRLLCDVVPHHIDEPDKAGDTALHEAVGLGLAEIAAYMLKLCPYGLEVQNQAGQTPLWAGLVDQEELVLALARQYPQALEMQDENGMLIFDAATVFLGRIKLAEKLRAEYVRYRTGEAEPIKAVPSPTL